MNKKSQNNISTQRILKSKYLEKSKTICLKNKRDKKIMLTDLCSEEKLKIGQLIKTLENRRIEIQQLTQQNKQQRQFHSELLAQIKAIQQQNIAKQRQGDQMRQQLIKLKKELQKKLSQQPEKIEKRFADRYKTVSIQTEIAKTIDFQSQTKKEKTKTKDRLTQTVEESLGYKSMLYRPHSKSFEKIMKGALNNLENTYTRSFHQNQQNQPENQEMEYDKFQNNQQNYSQESPSESCEQLAKKWNKLRAKNDRQTEKTTSNRSKIIDANNLQQRLKQFSLNDKKNPRQKQSKTYQLNTIDEMKLNRMLKSKNFSASKLLLHKVSKDSQSSVQNYKKHDEVSYLKKSPYFNETDEVLNSIDENKKRFLKTPFQTSNREINFFESDIVDIADSVDL